MNGLKLCLALAAGVTGVAAFAEYEQGPVYNQWSLFTGQAGKWRGVWTLLDGGFAPFPPPFGSVNIVKFEVQTGNGP